jgi:MFS transporter, UMF1 family
MAATEAEAAGRPAGDRRALAAWCLFDWANSAFPTIVTTFLFSAYFTDYVAATHAAGQSLWSLANGLAALVVALASPVLGAIADQGGRRKPWLLVLSLICVVATAALWFVRPDAGMVVYALVVAGIATIGFELGFTFYNAMLPDLVPRDHLGRLSGWGWGVGYAGGLACLGLSLIVFVLPEPPPFGLDPATAEDVRIVMPLAALWFALFALPLFLWTPDRPATERPLGRIVRGGLAELATTLRQVRRYRTIARFLLAKMIYMDGLNTLFVVGGTFAAGVYGMGVDEVLLFGVLLNVAAGAGAFAFAWVDDRFGAKPTILIALCALMLFGSGVLFVDDKLWFYALATALGIFLGPAQAASRSFMARLAPPAQRTEFFGLYNLAGKVTTPVGPLLVAGVTWLFDSQRAGMAAIIPFLLIGALLLLPVKEPRRSSDEH